MGNDHIIDHFSEIEEKIEKIVSQIESIRNENTELIKKKEWLERELKDRDEEKKVYEEEHEIIRAKIEKLLGRLNTAIQ